MVLDRRDDVAALADGLRRSPVVLLVGPRQSGKTTMARSVRDVADEGYFDLEDPRDLARLDEPMTALEPLTGVVVIDEIQRRPDLFPILRVLVDRRDSPARFLVLGSASPDALRQSGESLAGRVTVVELGGLRSADVGVDRLDRLWLRGGFPRSFLADDEADSVRWRIDYVRLLAGRDLPELGLRLPSATIERFLGLVAHYHGQLWNAAEPARALGISEATVRRYLDTLADALLIRVLPPWHTNTGKRLVRSPKVFYRDSGLAHTLLGIDSEVALLRHPRVGASWEGLIVEECIHRAAPGEIPYFWRTSNGAEIDLLLARGERLRAIEVKREDAPRLTPSMRSALQDLNIESITVYYPGQRRFRIHDHVEVVPASSLAR